MELRKLRQPPCPRVGTFEGGGGLMHLDAAEPRRLPWYVLARQTVSETNDGDEGAQADSVGAETEADAGEVDLAALAEEEGDPEEEGLDLSDLEAQGIEGVVAGMRSPMGEGEGEEDEAAMLDRARPRRSPFVSLLVVGFGAYLLITMFADFRYWLRSSTPVDLGHAATLLEDGRTLDAYDDQYVVLEGTPDVQHATKLTTKEQFIGYLRVLEGGGGLFAAVPRSKDKPVTNNFEGRYQGRLRRLSDDRAYEWLREFYANEKVTRIVDLEPRGFAAALGGPLPTMAGGTVDVAPDESLRLVFDGPDARVQLGTRSFRDAAAAQRAVAALGFPFLALEPTVQFHRFIVRIPEAERGEAQRSLNEGLAGVEGSSDPKVGALVLALPISYGAPAGEVALEGDALSFPFGDNTTTPGYDVKGDRLVERPPTDQLRLGYERLRSARLERVIEIDPDGFVVAVGEPPASELQAAILWLLVLAITGANTVSLVLWRRRRTA